MSALFVYGTLRSGAGHPMQATLAAAGRSLGATRVRGVLYTVDWYPGLVVAPDAGWVVGELWHLDDAGVLPTLDEYEGEEFRRETLACCGAWAYLYVGPTKGLDVVASGDWLAR